jgi:uncharacterized membrane protein
LVRRSAGRGLSPLSIGRSAKSSSRWAYVLVIIIMLTILGLIVNI